MLIYILDQCLGKIISQFFSSDFRFFSNDNLIIFLKGVILNCSVGEDKDTLIEHKFNRCVIFPGTLFHQIQDVIDKSEIRLSVYIGFQKQEGKEKNLYFDPATLKNALHKDAFVMEKLTKELHKDFGIGN
jgi:hypothetical protein